MKIVILGLSITSSWGNGHATTFRGLVRELSALGHDVLFLERDAPWYAGNRDLPHPPWGRTALYGSLPKLQVRFGMEVRDADAVIVGSYVPEGIAVGQWVQSTAQGVRAFYDIDTPVTLAKITRGECDYLTTALISGYGLYLSFAGGPTLTRLEQDYGSPCAKALYCSVDPDYYSPEAVSADYDLGYMGTYSEDRQPPLESLLLEPARRWREGRFAVAGPQYPSSIAWPPNVTRTEHLPPAAHRDFYNRQRFTLNITRADMIQMGYSPSVRLFEAAACGVPILSDYWDGLGTIFEIGTEILVTRSADDTLAVLRDMPDTDRTQIAARARARVMESHTAAHRAAELVQYLRDALTTELTTERRSI